MKILAVLLIILFIAAVCLLFTRIKINVTVQIDETVQYAEMTAKIAFGIITVKRRTDFPALLAKAGSGKKASSSTGDFNLKRYAGMMPEFRRMAGKMNIRLFSWKTAVGIGDAADTAIAYGYLWTVKTLSISLIEAATPIMKKQLHVEPDFQRMLLKTKLRCMMDIQAGNAILETFRLYRKMKKNSVQPVTEDRRSVHGGASH